MPAPRPNSQAANSHAVTTDSRRKCEKKGVTHLTAPVGQPTFAVFSDRAKDGHGKELSGRHRLIVASIPRHPPIRAKPSRGGDAKPWVCPREQVATLPKG